MMEKEGTDKTNQISSSKIKKLERNLWVLEGMISLNLNQELLEKVSSNFQKIDSVPSGYYYPELFVET